MTYCLLDDGFDTNHKLLALGTDARRWTWLRIILHTCRRNSDTIPREIATVVPAAKPNYIRDCIRIGLIDLDDNAVMHVHDWYLYSGASVEEKVKYFLSRYPDASANDVARQVVGTRSRILAAVRQQRGETPETSQNAGSDEPEAEPPSQSENGTSRTEKAVLAGARPLPLPLEEPRAVNALRHVAHDEPTNGPGSQLDEQDLAGLARVAGITPDLKEL